jgi:hypothetical protein
VPCEELNAKFILEEANPGCDVGLNHVQFDGCPIHTAASGYSIHDPQVIDVHHA